MISRDSPEVELFRAVCEEDDRNGLEEDSKVQPKRPSVNISKIELHPLIEIHDLVTAAHLPETRQPRAHAETPALISDNGCQPTFEAFMKASSALGIKQIFTSWNNPKGNADTERVMRTIKEDLVWPREWDFPFELERALKQ